MCPTSHRNEALRAVVLLSLVTLAAGVAAECSCDCCGVQAAPAWEKTKGSVECASLQTEACSTQCQAPSELSGGLLDYSPFCFDNCVPSSHEKASLCVQTKVLDTAQQKTVGAIETPPVEPDARGGAPIDIDATLIANERMLRMKKAKLRKAPTETGKVPQHALASKKADASPNELQMAKAAYLESKVHAKAAGAAARRAKESYELVKRSAREMSEYAGRMVYDEIQREAGEQSKKALDIRMAYVKGAQDTGIQNAKNAAAPYKTAAKVAAKDAADWNMRASELAASAGALKGQGEQMSKDATTYMGTQDYNDAEMYSRQAHQLIGQSQTMAGRADAAHAQAQEIQATLNWYALAGRGMAATALAGSMPYDVPPPPLPNTVFLQTREEREHERTD